MNNKVKLRYHDLLGIVISILPIVGLFVPILLLITSHETDYYDRNNKRYNKKKLFLAILTAMLALGSSMLYSNECREVRVSPVHKVETKLNEG